jgi:hypothetical protein
LDKTRLFNIVDNHSVGSKTLFNPAELRAPNFAVCKSREERHSATQKQVSGTTVSGKVILKENRA